MCDKADKDREDKAKGELLRENNRKCKRSLKLLRCNERDIKLDVESTSNNRNAIDELNIHLNNMKVRAVIMITLIDF